MGARKNNSKQKSSKNVLRKTASSSTNNSKMSMTTLNKNVASKLSNMSASYGLENDLYTVKVHMDDYTLENIVVKTKRAAGQNMLVIDAKKELSEEGHNAVTTYSSQYVVPRNVDLEKFNSKLTSDGLLCIEAPVKQQQRKLIERAIPLLVEKK